MIFLFLVYLPSLLASTALSFWNHRLGPCILPSSIPYATSFSSGSADILWMCQHSASTSMLWQELGQINVLLIEWIAFWEMVAILFNWSTKGKKQRKDVTKGFYPVKCKLHQERISWWSNVFLMWRQNDQQSITQMEEANKSIPVKEKS